MVFFTLIEAKNIYKVACNSQELFWWSVNWSEKGLEMVFSGHKCYEMSGQKWFQIVGIGWHIVGEVPSHGWWPPPVTSHRAAIVCCVEVYGPVWACAW